MSPIHQRVGVVVFIVDMCGVVGVVVVVGVLVSWYKTAGKPDVPEITLSLKTNVAKLWPRCCGKLLNPSCARGCSMTTANCGKLWHPCGIASGVVVFIVDMCAVVVGVVVVGVVVSWYKAAGMPNVPQLALS